MEMKPEYNHGKIEYYYLELWGKHIKGGAINAYKALNALRELGHYRDYSFWKFWSLLRGQYGNSIFWHGLHTFDESEYQRYLTTLVAAGTSPEACRRTVYYLFLEEIARTPPDAAYGVSDDLYTFHFSMFMNGFGEYSLEKWATHNNIQVAYRLSNFATSPIAGFTLVPDVIRVWKDETGVHHITKKWVAAEFCNQQPPQKVRGQVSNKDWNSLHEHMLAEFWSDKGWKHYPGPDSSTYYFEGWNNGQFKITKTRLSPNNLAALGWDYNKMHGDGARKAEAEFHAIDLFHKIAQSE